MSEEFASADINPWWGIWVQPRQTIRYLVDTDPKMYFWLLVVFYGIIRAIAMGVEAGLGEIFTPSQIAAFILFAGPVSGVIGVFLTGSLLELVGKLFGGRAEGQHVRTVLAWATIPMGVLVIVGILPLFALFGSNVFAGSGMQAQQTIAGSGSDFAFLDSGLLTWRTGMEIAGSLYYLVIAVAGLAEVHDFSVWKAAGTVFVVIGGLLLGLMLLATFSLGS